MNSACESHIRPKITDYTYCREILDAFCMYKKLTRRGFSFRSLAKACGLKSPGFFSDVIAGRKSLNSRLAKSAAQVLGLNLQEQCYFIALVEYELTSDISARTAAHQAVQCARTHLLFSYLGDNARSRLSQWYAMTLRDLLLLPGFKASASDISLLFHTFVSEQEVAMTTADLIKEGLILQQADGTFLAGLASIIYQGEKCPYENFALLSQIFDYWRAILPNSPRDLTLTTIAGLAVPASKIPELKQRIDKVCDELLGAFSAPSENADLPDTIVHLGFFLVPAVSSKLKS